MSVLYQISIDFPVFTGFLGTFIVTASQESTPQLLWKGIATGTGSSNNKKNACIVCFLMVKAYILTTENGESISERKQGNKKTCAFS